MKIEIKGVIIPDSEQWIYDWFEIPACSPSKVNKALAKAKGKDVEVIINSGGGSVVSGSEIYTSLKDYKGKTTGKIVGIAGSAASVCAMGVTKLLISPTAQIMIHNASTNTQGNKNELAKTIEMLSGFDKSIANAYMLKTNLSQAELLELMNRETFLIAQEAKEIGFVDEIMFDDGVKFVASINNSGLLPQTVIDKVRNELKTKTRNDNTEDLESLKAVNIEVPDIPNVEANNLKVLKAKLLLECEL